jgi:Protein of unknown function (DUF2877)
MPAPRSDAGRVAASTRTRHLVAGPRRAGHVLGVFRTAVYVGFSPSAGSDLVAVETTDGLRLPCAATLAVPSSAAPFQAISVGDDAQVGEDRIDIGTVALDVVRWWTPRRPRTVTLVTHAEARLDEVAGLLPALSSELEERLGSLMAALTASNSALLSAPTNALLGLGPGLTPEGDDLLAGVLVALHAAVATRPLARELGDVVAGQAATRTTTLSAALLREAADGYAIPALVDLVDALDEAQPADLSGSASTHPRLAVAVLPLLAVGHTSGTALAHGALAAARLRATMAARGEES